LAEIAKDELANGRQRKIRGVKIEWATLARPDFFEIDRENFTISLNRNYRKAILGGRRATVADAPLIKLLLFFLLQEELKMGRLTASRKSYLDSLNRLLSESVEYEDRE
jgi:hypothetical protein